MHQQLLHDNWTVQPAGTKAEVPAELRSKNVKAHVPGCVHTDLLAAKLIDDPYYDRNELKLQWIGRTDWRYSLTFKPDAALKKHEHVELVCEGLDTVARVELNGQLLAETQDMHVPYRFNVKEQLRPDKNELVITFSSALKYAEAMEQRLGARPHVEKHPYNFIRKMACNFGWDWGPTLITAGIWRPIYLQSWNTARIRYVRPLVLAADQNKATLDLRVDLAGATAGTQIRAVLSAPNRKKFTQNFTPEGQTARASIEVPNPQLWWPHGHGKQPLYDLNLRLEDSQGKVLDQWSGRVGLRSVRLNTDKDQIGSKFVIEVNGKPIFCKGANWIPDDCFNNRVDAKRYRRRIEQALGANMNMLRVWGGGVFENDTFFSICDELGVMVWHDFLFACAMYPEEAPFDQLVEAEARNAVAALSWHPSLVIWNGCNENFWAYFNWGFKDKLKPGQSWGVNYYLKLLPAIVKEVDPSRPFWPGSPFSGTLDIPPLDDNHGNKHIWDVWQAVDYTHYRKHQPRFASEFGFQGAATYATLKSALPDEQLKPDAPGLIHHQKAYDGMQRLTDGTSPFFNIPQDYDSWLFIMQLNQARAVQLGVEWLRSRQPRCMGTLYWQINDCWPVISWACIDSEGRLKPLWYETRRFFADRLLTIQPLAFGAKRGEGLELHILNDSDNPWQSEALIRRIDFDGKTLAEKRQAFEVSARSRGAILLEGDRFNTPLQPEREMLLVQADGLRACWYFEPDKNLAYPKPEFQLKLAQQGKKYRVKVTAQSFLRDLALFADRPDPNATVNDQLVTLLPGESFTFMFDSAKKLSAECLGAPPVLQCANHFGRSGAAR